MRWKQFIIIMIMVALASPVMQLGDADAKRKKRRYSPPPLKILHISTSPTPFAPGNGPLAITIDVGLPKNLSNVDLLEVSSMISFPSKRSIRFLYSRHPIEEAVFSGGKAKISATLLWDGKDQTNQLVSARTYKYEIRAQLMSNTDGPPRTKMVSLRARGELEVSSPESLANSEAHLEHVPLISDGTPSEEIGAGSDPSTAEAEVSENKGLSAQEQALEEYGYRGRKGLSFGKSVRGPVEKCRQRRSRCEESSTYLLYALNSSLPAALLDSLFQQAPSKLMR